MSIFNHTTSFSLLCRRIREWYEIVVVGSRVFMQTATINEMYTASIVYSRKHQTVNPYEPYRDIINKELTASIESMCI